MTGSELMKRTSRGTTMDVNDTAFTRPLSPELGGLLRGLCVVLRIAPDARWERRGSHLWQAMTLPVEERGLETPIAMPTLHAPVPLVMPVSIPPGTVLCVPQ
jgi:hypothetical protein